MKHAHTIGPDGSLYACPGFTGQLAMSTGHIDDRRDPGANARSEQFERLDPWKECGDCAFIPCVPGAASPHRIHTAWRHEHADMSQAEL